MSAGVVSLTAEKYLTRFALPNFYFSRDNGLRYSPAQRGHPRQARLPGRALPGLAALLIIAHPRRCHRTGGVGAHASQDFLLRAGSSTARARVSAPTNPDSVAMARLRRL